MKKILFLLLICVIKLSAYEYLIYQTQENINSPTTTRFVFYIDSNGILYQKQIRQDGYISYVDSLLSFYNSLGYIKRNIGNNTYGYINANTFKSYYINDNLFLNDLYSQKLQPFLNYLYNPNNFTNTNYIEYSNYELLFNSDGLAVESIVDGVWAGLYDDANKGSSGKLYDSNGVLVYVNAEPVSIYQQWFDPFLNAVNSCLLTAFSIMASPVGVVVSVVFVFSVLYLIVWVSRKSLRGRDGF